MNREDNHKHEFVFDTKFKTLAIPAYVIGVCKCGEVTRITTEEYKRKYCNKEMKDEVKCNGS